MLAKRPVNPADPNSRQFITQHATHGAFTSFGDRSNHITKYVDAVSAWQPIWLELAVALGNIRTAVVDMIGFQPLLRLRHGFFFIRRTTLTTARYTPL